jgi:sugar phosphate permease
LRRVAAGANVEKPCDVTVTRLSPEAVTQSHEAATMIEQEIAHETAHESRQRWATVLALGAGYIGIYLCRKNLSVALPLLGTEFGASKSQLGWITTISTLAYAAGKLSLGPVIDRVGGRLAFLTVLGTVAALGAASALAPGLLVLTLLYSANRYFGAGGWPSMMQLVPTWFAPSATGRVTALLSLSYVGGGVLATLLARQVVLEGGGWRAVFVVPSLVLLAVAAACVFFVRGGPLTRARGGGGARGGSLWDLLARPQFVLVCLLSLTLSLVREAFNTWSVDFLKSVQGADGSLGAAALGSTTFDLAGMVSIVLMGSAWDAVPGRARRFLLAGLLAALAVLIAILPEATATGGATLLGAVGLFSYGPYSLLAGALAIAAGGPGLAATASGFIDAVGYAGGALAGAALGGLLDLGGYTLGFRCLAGVAAVSALLALGFKDAEPER